MSVAGEYKSGDRFLFGPFEFRPAERLLLCRGVPVSLGGRPMDILLCLIERQGDVVSYNELLASVWRRTNVELSAMRVQISVLRRTLVEADPDARYVSNITGRGYCFVAWIVRDAAEIAPAGLATDAPVPPPVPSARRMVGRESVVDALEQQIATERFVTLVGPGGIGKTTVALAIAHRMSHRFDGDVAFVDLSIQRGDDDIAFAVATALRLNRLEGDPVAAVASQLRSRRLLLILDNCEHVITSAAFLAETLGLSVPQCHILATSREPLNALGEQVHRLATLETPPSETVSFEEVCGYPAAQLFVERAVADGGQIEGCPADARLVADICRKLDGIPLAIELVAGQVDAFGLATTHELLESRLRLSWPGRRTAPPRHVTLGATLDWSYDLLSAEEAALLRALSAFVGSFPLDAAEAVADDSQRAEVRDVLAGLIAKSLVSCGRERTPIQFWLLDTTRQYARLKLEAAEESQTAARHAAWTLDDLRNSQGQLPEVAVRGLTQEWLDYFGNRIQDAQSALDWSLSANGDPSFAVPLTLASIPIWSRLYRTDEARRRIEAALMVVEPDSRSEMLLTLSLASYALENDVSRAESASARALELASAFDDWSHQFRARYLLWNTHIGVRPDIQKARGHALLYRQLAGMHGGASEQATAEHMVGLSEFAAGNLAVARASVDRARVLSPTRNPGADNTLISLLWLDGMPDTAAVEAQENLKRANATGFVGYQASALADACELAMSVGDLAGAVRYAEMIDDCVTHGAWFAYRTWAQFLRATIAAHRGDPRSGRSLLARRLPMECAHPRFASVLVELALRLGAAGAGDVARGLADHLMQRVESTGERWIWSEVQRVRGELSDDAAAAEALFQAALAQARRQGAHAWALRAATSLARRRRGATAQVLKPLLASFTEGAGTRDHVEARSLLSECGVDLP